MRACVCCWLCVCVRAWVPFLLSWYKNWIGTSVATSDDFTLFFIIILVFYVCVRARVRACVRAYVRACARTCVRACACVLCVPVCIDLCSTFLLWPMETCTFISVTSVASKCTISVTYFYLRVVDRQPIQLDLHVVAGWKVRKPCPALQCHTQTEHYFSSVIVSSDLMAFNVCTFLLCHVLAYSSNTDLF